MTELTRREFLKLAGVTTALLALSDLAPRRILRPIEKAYAQVTAGGVKYVPSVCGMCSTKCSILVKVENGRVVRILGNPGNPVNGVYGKYLFPANAPDIGAICGRGNSGIFRHYHPDRLKYHLIRDDPGTRGQWKFRKASFDEAVTRVAEQIKKYLSEGAPYKIGALGGWPACAIYKPFFKAFMMTIGSPHGVGIPAPQCFLPRLFAWKTVVGVGFHEELIVDYDHVRYLIIAGRNTMGSIGIPHSVKLGRNFERIEKIVVLDPRLSETAAKADEWIALKPGSDLAFFLAMMNVIVREKMYDAEYLKKYTTAPILLDPEKGTPIKTWKEGGKIKYVVYDKARGTAVPHDEAEDPALTGEYTVSIDGKSTKAIPAFQLFMNIVEKYTPEWASEKTGVSAETIARIAREFATKKPSAIDPGWHGIRHKNEFLKWRAAALLNILVGGFGKEGGVLMTYAGLEATLAKKAVFPPENSPVRVWAREHGVVMDFLGFTYQEFYDAITTGKPAPLKLLFLPAINLFRTLSDHDKWAEALKKLDMVVAIDILPQDHLLYADVVFAGPDYLERYDAPFKLAWTLEGGVYFRNRAVEPLYKDTKTIPEVLISILSKVGPEYYEKYFKVLGSMTGADPLRLKELYEKSGYDGIVMAIVEAIARKKGKSFEEVWKALSEKGFVVTLSEDEVRKEQWKVIENHELFTPSGRIEFYSFILLSGIKRVGAKPFLHPLITYVPPDIEGKAQPEKGVFYLTYGKIPTMSHASTADNPILVKLTPDEYYRVWIHPEPASKLGIREGDWVVVRSRATGGETRVKAHVTKKVRPDTVWMSFAFGQESPAMRFARRDGPEFSKLTPLTVEPITGSALLSDYLVEIRRG